MKRKEHLYQLIKSLTRSEKRFFKIYSSRHVIGKQNKYVELFDAIDQQSEYDEAKLFEQFKGEKFINRFAVAKAYLYDLILKSMNQYRAQKTVLIQLKNQIQSVSFLVEKNLIEQANRLIKKIKKQALEHEMLNLLPEILSWEKQIMETQFYSGRSMKEIEKLQVETKSYLDQLLNLNDFWFLNARLYYQYNRQGIVRNKEDLQQIENVIHAPLMKSEEQALSFSAKRLQYKIYSTYFFILRDFESCFKYATKLIELLESRPKIIAENPMEYVRTLNNLINMTGVLARVDETQLHIAKLKKMMQEERYAKDDNLQLKLFESYYYHIINYHRNRRDFESGLKHIKAIDKGLQKFGKKVNEVGEMMLCYHVFQLCYGAKRYEWALEWINRIVNNSDPKVHHEIFMFSKILKIILEYHLKQKLSYQKSIKETYIFLKQRETKYRFEQLLIDFFKELPKIKTQLEFIVVLEKYKTYFDKLSEDPFERKAFVYFDFKQWITSEIAHLKSLQTSTSNSNI